MSIDLALTGPWWAWALVVGAFAVMLFILYGAVAEAYIAGVRRAWEPEIQEAEKRIKAAGRQVDETVQQMIAEVIPLQREQDDDGKE